MVIAIGSMFLLLYLDNIVIARKPSGAITCANIESTIGTHYNVNTAP